MDGAVLPVPSPDWALFLDVDGTLIEIADAPDAVSPDVSLPSLLQTLSDKLGGAVALVSGRPVSSLDRLFAPLRLPAAGLHGLERRDAAGHLARPVRAPPALDAARRAIRGFSDRHRGIVVEDKGLTIALHFRRIPDIGPEATEMVESLVARLDGGLKVQKGKMVIEVRPEGPDKGAVIRSFMAEPPFAGRVPVFVGDDVTDEAGFAVVNEMGGHSIRVGGSEATLARARIATVGDLLSWLDSVAAVAA